MKVSLHWLREYIDLRLSVPELETLLRRAGLEVAGVETRGVSIDRVVVARILESVQHPNADRLSVCKVDDGSGTPRQIVCGAKNYKVGDHVPLALPGAVLPGDFKIKVGKLRGVESEGMMCSAKELRLAEDSEGLLILPRETVPGTPLSDVFPADTIVELEITPNRPDWLSHVGVAREIGVFTETPLRPPAIPTPTTQPAGEAVMLQAPECSYYTLRRITGVKVGPSPQWLQDRLQAVGLRPVNNVVDVTNFVLFELGQPLHAFDAAKIHGGLRVRRAAEDETFRALDGRDYVLDPADLVIADANRAVALAGVMGGEDSGVTESTTDILLESAVFEPSSVRRTSRRLGLISDSSYRFERGVDPETVAAASARATELILQVAGGEAADALLEAGTHWARPEVTLRHARARAVLGTDFDDTEMESALRRAGFEPLSGGVESSWAIPGFRQEVRREADLIEEIVRILGIERIEGRTAGLFAPATVHDAAYDFATSLRHRLVGAGLHEARTSTLVSEADAAWFGPAVALRNPFGDDQSRLRTSLLPGLLSAIRRNVDQGAKSIALFEIGRVFHPDAESPRLAIAATGFAEPATWRGGVERPWDFYDLKGLVREVARPGEALFEPLLLAPEPFGAAADVLLAGRRIGVVGVLQPAECRRLGTGTIVAAEFDLDAWRLASSKPPTATPIPKFPASARDIAVIAPLDLPYSRVSALIAASNEPLLESAELFDLFTDPTGQKLPADRKSLAISLTFRSVERTLNTEEINAATDRIKAGLKTGLGVEFRE
ncbi:MAG: phenylalanine--tRNA ligase subunit beta [Terrimicrobiaceae bacterium]|nr:phenylalanine--tRNA ligase subunit beta [Terrimicrobiaceae bacterium]